MENKKIFIIGDSYSTYEGYIPEGYSCYYGDKCEDKPFVSSVEKTWWRILAKENNLEIALNDSFSGSTVCNTVRENYTIASSFISRIDKYIADGFFEKNNVDTMLIFGSTNDSWISAPVGELVYSAWTPDSLKCVLPAFCYLLSRAKTVVREIVVIVNTELSKAITDGLIKASEDYQVKCVILENIDKQSGHPTELGMKQIAEQVSDVLNRK